MRRKSYRTTFNTSSHTMKITLELDTNALARLRNAGAGVAFGQSAEILGNDFLEAFQQAEKNPAVKGAVTRALSARIALAAKTGDTQLANW